MIQDVSRYKDEDPKGYKSYHNNLLVNWTTTLYSESYLKEKGNALYLDGPCLGSTQIFQNCFSQCIVPQMNKNEYEMMNEKNKERNVKIYNIKLKEYIENNRYEISQCQLIYLDTMQIVYGSVEKQIYPLQDLDQILKYTQQKQMVVGLTFVSRMYRIAKLNHKDDKIKFSYKRESTKEMWQEFINPVIRSRGFEVKDIFVNEYCKNYGHSAPMVFFAIKIERNNLLLKKKEKFHLHPCREFRLGFDQNSLDEYQKVKKNTKLYKKNYNLYYNLSKQYWTLPSY